MPRAFCNTSCLQYLYQLDLLELLPKLIGSIVVPPAVKVEILRGKAARVALPDLDSLSWLSIRAPRRPLQIDPGIELGLGESEVLALGLEHPETAVVLDDGLARAVAEKLGLRLTGTIGLLLDAKKAGLLARVRPELDRLQALRFRLAAKTRAAALAEAGELVVG